MPVLVVPVVVLLVVWAAITVIGVLFHPIWKPCVALLDKLAAPIAGAVGGVEQGAREFRRGMRQPLASSARFFLYGDVGRPHAGWPWRCVVKPFLSLAIATFVIMIEFDLGALAWQVKFHTGPVPNLHLPLSLLMGMMWPIVAVAWGDALFDLVDRKSIGPWADYPRLAKRLLAVVLVAGLLAGVVGNMLFFVWRGGQLENVNPYTNLSAPINLLLGGLLCFSPVLAGAVGLRFVTVIVPLVLGVMAFALLVLEKAAHVTRLALEAVEAAAKVVLLLFNSLGTQVIRVLEAIADSAVAWVKASGRERTRQRAVARRQAPQQPAPQQAGPGFGRLVGSAVLEGTRAFWMLTDVSVRGIGNGVGGVAAAGASLVAAFFAACAVAVVGLLKGLGVGITVARRAVGAVADALGDALATLARCISIVGVAISHVAVAVVRPVLILLAAIAIWVFYAPTRVRWSLVAWVCRFDFFVNKVKLRPLPDPPPKKRMEWRLNRLGAHDRASGILISTPPAGAPSASGASDLVIVVDQDDVLVDEEDHDDDEPLDPPAAVGA